MFYQGGHPTPILLPSTPQCLVRFRHRWDWRIEPPCTSWLCLRLYALYTGVACTVSTAVCQCNSAVSLPSSIILLLFVTGVLDTKATCTISTMFVHIFTNLYILIRTNIKETLISDNTIQFDVKNSIIRVNEDIFS